jgi:hypothetical protein
LRIVLEIKAQLVVTINNRNAKINDSESSLQLRTSSIKWKSQEAATILESQGF